LVDTVPFDSYSIQRSHDNNNDDDDDDDDDNESSRFFE
jgi:hypothetical protein